MNEQNEQPIAVQGQESSSKPSILVRIFEITSIVFLSAMILMVFVNAVLRYFFNTAITESEELSRFLFIWIVFTGAMVALKQGKLVSITALSDALKGKSKLLLLAIQKLLVWFVIVFTLYSGILFTMQSTTHRSPGLRLNFGYVAVSVPIMAFGMLLIEVTDTYKSIKSKKQGKKEE